jgi:hypothetical protein
MDVPSTQDASGIRTVDPERVKRRYGLLNAELWAILATDSGQGATAASLVPAVAAAVAAAVVATCAPSASRFKRQEGAGGRVSGRAKGGSGLGVDVKVIQTPRSIFCVENH